MSFCNVTAGNPTADCSIWKIASGFIVIALMTYHLRRIFIRGELLESMTFLLVPVSVVLGVWLLVQGFRVLLKRPPADWNPRELLLLIPVLQIPGTALSSRGGPSVLEVYPQAAILLLLLPISLSSRMRGALVKTAYLALAGLIAISAGVAKTLHPYYWNHFVDRTMFADRVWYRHPIYGPMYIERDHLKLMQEMCGVIGSDGPPKELLTITNPYPNYFCDVTPWHGYVQTWYDTVNKDVIDTLISELESAPPQWIIYQRALDTMAGHEHIFNGGKPLPHRALDALIMERIASGQWQVSYQETFDGADWMVIRTRP